LKPRVLRPATFLALVLLAAPLGAATPAGTRIEALAPTLRYAGEATARTRVESELSLQLRQFPARGPKGEARFQPSAAGRVTVSRDWHDGRDALTITPFLRVDAEDGRRTHADLREAFYRRVGEGYELHAGLKRVFWGVVESKHLVDVINQVDLVEDIDEEARLGQPMVQLVVPRESGTLELFWLPGARERTFPGGDGRLLGPVVVDGDGRFTADAADRLRSWAVRWSGFAGGLEYGVAHFSGTARDPRFEVAVLPVPGEPVRVRALYETLSRTSLDAQYILGDTALKLELVARRGQGPASTAFVAGFEHTFVGAFGSRADVGLLAEYLFDDRGDDAPLLAFEHDVFAGVRVALNDLAGSQLLAGAIVDHRTGETITSVEASRRLGERWRLGLDLRTFSGSRLPALGDAPALLDPQAKWGVLRDEDYLQLELTRYF